MRGFDVEELMLAQEKARITLRVFVGGPYVELDKPAPTQSSGSAAALLRYTICKYIEDELGYKVSIGESKKLQEMYKNHLSDMYDASSFELLHARKSCDAVIIFPSSPGSFCEFGFFSADNLVCSKMLVVRDQLHLASPGYVHFGPSEQAKGYNARVVDLDYQAHDTVKKEVSEFLSRIVTKKLLEEVRIP